jgi:hypothetical protein
MLPFTAKDEVLDVAGLAGHGFSRNVRIITTYDLPCNRHSGDAAIPPRGHSHLVIIDLGPDPEALRVWIDL